MSMVDEAIKYAKMGMAVFPVSRDKIPLTKRGFKDASKSEKVIRNWWQKKPYANIAIATGQVSGGIIVIDIDIDEDKGVFGDESLREWEKEHGKLPDTWTAITGRGGYHYYYRTDQEVHNATNLYPGIDVRGDGGYVVIPPSVHNNGRTYEWEYAPGDVDLKMADDQVFAFLKQGKPEDHGQDEHKRFVLPDVIKNGSRNDTLYKYGCSLQSKGHSDEDILDKLEEANQRCETPLSDKEINIIHQSVLKKEKGNAKAQIVPPNADAAYRAPDLWIDDKGRPIQNIRNIREAIQYDPWLYKKIRKNEIAYTPYVFGSLPWDKRNNIREWDNEDDANLKEYIESKYGLRPTEKIMDALTIVAGRNQYNPVIDTLMDRWYQWDGQEHIKHLLPDYLGVEPGRYSEEVLKLFMLGAISRVYHPGCKFDFIPIIYGAQGCGKSTFCRVLAMADEWYDDNFNTIEGDKASEKLRGLWMAEFAELLATKKAKEIESIKSFLTSRSDNYRPPYSRRTEHRKRVCVFIGTTNSNHFLTDRTGNRRFLPLIAKKDRAKTPITDPKYYRQAVIDVNNAWGEAMDIFFKADKQPLLVLPADLDAEVKNMQTLFLEDNPATGKIQAYLDDNKIDRVCVLELWEKALGYSGNPTRYDSNFIHTIMQQEIKGWVRADKRQRCGIYGLQVCYQKIKNFTETDEELPFPKV